MSKRREPSPLLGIFLTVFLDLIGFGMFIPDIQLRGAMLARQYLGLAVDSTDPRVGFMVGAILGGYSLAQLIGAPLLGRWSDRIGRRKILLVTSALSFCSYVLYAHATSFEIILIARMLSGIAASNLSVAFAYVSDVTEPENRAKGFGMVGAALGMGFILGPPLGSLTIRLGHDRPEVLGYVGAALVLVNLAYIALFLPEPERHAAPRQPFFTELGLAFRSPGLPLLLAMYFAFNFGFANLQSTFFLLLADPRSVFHLTPDAAKVSGGIILALVGVMGAVMQGLAVPRLMPKLGEVRMLKIGFLITAPMLAALPYAPLWAPTLIVTVLMGVGNGIAQPPLNALVSKSAPRALQGGIFGVTQALGALARLLGPIISNVLFAARPEFPYLLGGACVLIPAIGSWFVRTPGDSSSPNRVQEPGER